MAFAPKSTRAVVQEQTLAEQMRELLRTVHGYHDPRVLRAEREHDRVTALFTVEQADGLRKALTAYLEPTGELVVVAGFQV